MCVAETLMKRAQHTEQQHRNKQKTSHTQTSVNFYFYFFLHQKLLIIEPQENFSFLCPISHSLSNTDVKRARPNDVKAQS